MLRDTILSLLSRPPHLNSARKYIKHAHERPLQKIGTWKCLCGHTNPVYHIPNHLHPIGMMACDREDCDLTWHPSTSPIDPHRRSDLMAIVRLPNPNNPREDDAPYILPYPKKVLLEDFEDSAYVQGYGYICLNEKCGLSWATKVVKEWRWGSSRKILAVAGRRCKVSCLCGRRVQVGGGFAVFEIVQQ